jgi:hypothetical protein
MKKIKKKIGAYFQLMRKQRTTLQVQKRYFMELSKNKDFKEKLEKLAKNILENKTIREKIKNLVGNNSKITANVEYLISLIENNLSEYYNICDEIKEYIREEILDEIIKSIRKRIIDINESEENVNLVITEIAKEILEEFKKVGEEEKEKKEGDSIEDYISERFWKLKEDSDLLNFKQIKGIEKVKIGKEIYLRIKDGISESFTLPIIEDEIFKLDEDKIFKLNNEKQKMLKEKILKRAIRLTEREKEATYWRLKKTNISIHDLVSWEGNQWCIIKDKKIFAKDIKNIFFKPVDNQLKLQEREYIKDLKDERHIFIVGLEEVKIGNGNYWMLKGIVRKEESIFLKNLEKNKTQIRDDILIKDVLLELGKKDKMLKRLLRKDWEKIKVKLRGTYWRWKSSPVVPIYPRSEIKLYSSGIKVPFGVSRREILNSLEYYSKFYKSEIKEAKKIKIPRSREDEEIIKEILEIARFIANREKNKQACKYKTLAKLTIEELQREEKGRFYLEYLFYMHLIRKPRIEIYSYFEPEAIKQIKKYVKSIKKDEGLTLQERIGKIINIVKKNINNEKEISEKFEEFLRVYLPDTLRKLFKKHKVIVK